MLFRRATADDAESVIGVVLDRLQWLRGQGLDQWSTRDQESVVRGNIRDGVAWLLEDGGKVVGTMAMSPSPPAGLWTDAELATPALYVAKLATALPGRGIGQLLLACAGATARAQQLPLLRWDAWSTNAELHAYYRALPSVRMLRIVPDQASGALFELATDAMGDYAVPADVTLTFAAPLPS